MKKLAFLGGVAGLGLAALLTTASFAADHLDSLGLATTPLADINDVYTWMNNDATKLNLVMTVSPADPGTRAFNDTVQYVFHVASRAGAPTAVVGHPGDGDETKVICTFASNTSVQCWVVGTTGVKDYVTGDPSATTGLVSKSGKVRVYAGRRSDPFFFNLQGFRNAVSALLAALPTGGTGGVPITKDAAGCPNNVPNGTIGALGAALSAQHPTDATALPPCPATTKDCFAALNVLSLVVQVDKTLVNSTGNTNIAVWASTHAKP